MPDDSLKRAAPVLKSSGVTAAERYLESVCQRNFLSFWSYPRPFRDQGGNKEICDLLVVMGDDVIVFSGKHCVLEPKRSLVVDWQRWFRAAVQAGAKQAWGAERWLRDYPQRVFLDPECTRPLPVSIPTSERTRFHLVVTVHGVSAACHAFHGGTGSLMLRTDLRGFAAHIEPFAIGDLDPQRTFVHVFDDATLDFVMSTLDTTSDVLRYLRDKEQLSRSHTLFVAGEENLLAHYLTHLSPNGDHAFVFESDVVGLDETWWDNFSSSDERRSQLEADRISYVWDGLIEKFAHHALAGTQYMATEPALESSEIVLRFMAAETRFRRRMLADGLMEAIQTTPADQRRIRVIPGQTSDEPMYVFLLLPWGEAMSDDDNRALRRRFLECCLHVARAKYGRALDVIGIATESGADHDRRTEDILYFDTRDWNSDDEELAASYQRDFGILVADQMVSQHVEEYPVSRKVQSASTRIQKYPRNKPCPCGNGRKYKHCHGK